MTGRGKHQRIKTTCPKGHRYSGVNKKGARVCEICRKEANARAKAKRAGRWYKK